MASLLFLHGRELVVAALVVVSLSLLLSGALGSSGGYYAAAGAGAGAAGRVAVECERLPARLCAFAVSSASRRCVLENTQRAGRPTEYQCRTSGVVVAGAASGGGGLVETDACVRACGVDRATVGISSDALLDPRVAAALCSPACLQGCPNVVDLHANLAAGEGVLFSELCEVHRANPRRIMAQLHSSGEAPAAPGTGLPHAAASSPAAPPSEPSY